MDRGDRGALAAAVLPGVRGSGKQSIPSWMIAGAVSEPI
jgi:hypothetical protein